MFDFSKIEFIDRAVNRNNRKYSFVGIQKNQHTGKMEFWLPLGFEDFPKDYESVKDFFFAMYKTYKKYLAGKKMEDEKLDNQRDGLYDKKMGGFKFTTSILEDQLLYSKLNAFDKIIDGYDELRIASMERKVFRSSVLDYSQIHKYLHKAIYLDQDVIYIDEMNMPKSVIVKNHTPIIELFCYIYNELKKELKEEREVTYFVYELAEQYKIENLTEIHSLFNESTFKETIDILKESFDDIDRNTIYKDDDYWHFFEAIESFLYAENDFDKTDDIYWGIQNFSFLWEEMCQCYAMEHYENIMYIERNNILEKHLEIKGDPYKLTMSNTTKFRFLRPDLVLIEPYPFGIKRFLPLLYKKEKVNIPNTSKINYRAIFSKSAKNKFYDIVDIYDEMCLRYSKRYNETRDIFYQNLTKENFKNFEKKALSILGNLDILELIALLHTSTVIDFKYMDVRDYSEYSESQLNYNYENKIHHDIKKQLVYEYTLQNNYPSSTTKSEFWIPAYLNNDQFKKRYLVSNIEFSKNKIDLFQINFRTIQENYLKPND